MKSRFAKMTAATLAMSMCLSATAFASGAAAPAPNTETKGSFNTSFDVYSPALHVSVPLKADIEVNPMADSTADGVRKFSVASNSIDIINASVDTEADAAIPVNVTVNAAITKTGDGVVTEYNTFTPDATSTKKRIHLELTEAKTAATLDESQRAPSTGDTKLLDLGSVSVDTAAVYTGATNQTMITKYGSLLSVDIAAPGTEDTTNNSYVDPTQLNPKVGSFAVTGVANTNADWKADDVAVAITYNVKASKALSIATPQIATAPTWTSGTSATDLSVVVPNVGEATVVAMALHNDGLYKDFTWESDAYKVAYAPNGSASTQTDATITIPKDDAALALLAGDDVKTKAQDLVIALSDGRMVVSTLTVN